MTGSGDYTTSAGSLTITSVKFKGTIDVAGVSVPFPSLVNKGSAGYAVSGNTLTLTITDPAVGTVNQVYTRA